MIIKALTTSWILFFLTISTAFADNSKTSLNRCESNNEKTEIFVTTNERGFLVSTQYSSRTLNIKSRSSLAGDFVVGLTSLESKTAIDIAGPVWEDLTKEGECFAAKIKIQLSYEPIQVYIGNEFAEGSCSYNSILEHEMQHVVLHQNSLQLIGNTIKDLMERRFLGKPIYANNNSARQMLEAEIDEIWRPLIKAEFAKVQMLQKELDSEENINKVTWSCLGEIQSKFGYRYK
ncbi:hypothetical protein [Undibacterium flavidum]|uniref:Uncharacterized protein n=1 Tax=Undibacterium flavidum TaxID=2762297 RepID=A0ABR6YDF9_9BURK|nr:hypothetical protein [Undibacterium flavidum]MBC3874580.1 hypothetical protein [Undibacterium flavidum]